MEAFPGINYLMYCLNRLSAEIGARPAGSRAHREAANFIAAEMKKAGYEVLEQDFPCPDWQAHDCRLMVAGKPLRAVVNTFSPSCDVKGELVPVASKEDLQGIDLTHKIALVHGEITRHGFMPKNFDRRYFEDKNKDRFMELLEKCNPRAVITVSHYDIPLPVIEESEWNLPSVTVHGDEGAFLVDHAGEIAELKVTTVRRPGSGANIIGRWGKGPKRILICAHYDTKPGTPGAMDNGSGIAALLLLARYVKEMNGETAVELVAFGGEDSWFPGDAMYIQEYPPDNLVAAINIDGIGCKDTETVMAFFNCPDQLVSQISEIAGGLGDFVPGPFYESDHGFFWPLGIPTLAFTSNCVELLGRVTHTENDTMEILDLQRIHQTVTLIREIVDKTLVSP